MTFEKIIELKSQSRIFDGHLMILSNGEGTYHFMIGNPGTAEISELSEVQVRQLMNALDDALCAGD